MKIKILKSLENLLNKKKILKSRLLSSSFNINCFKIRTEDNKNYIIKFYEKKNYFFNAINAETKNLIYFNKKKVNIFPKVINYNDEMLISEFIEHNNIKPKKINMDFIKLISSIHLNSGEKYGFNFDTQIGGMQQKNNFENSWVVFFGEKRLNDVLEIINKTNPLPKSISKDIELLIKNLHNRIPYNPIPSLLHGDLWDGNILFNDEKLVGLIDPGSFFGHNEMEIAYLRWFNPSYIDNNLIEIYNDFIKIDKSYLSYEKIYQLYYSLMNVLLWDRSYINDVKKLLDKIKI